MRRSADSGLIFRIIIVAAAAAVLIGIGTGIWNSYTSGHYDTVQDSRSHALDADIRARLSNITNTITAFNTSITAKIASVNQSCLPPVVCVDPNQRLLELEAYIVGNTSLILDFANERILTVNGVRADNGTGNLQLTVTGNGLSITAMPLLNLIEFENTGITSLSAGMGIALNGTTGHVLVSNTGVVQLVVEDGDVVVEPDVLGQIHMIGTNGVNVSGSNNTVTTSGLELQIAIDNLMAVISMQSMHITNITTEIELLRVDITNLQSINDTALICNETVTQIQMDIDILTETLLNFTTMSGSLVHTGSLLPWSGHPVTIPSGYLFCDGSTYPVPVNPSDALFQLYAVIGNYYCSGAGECMNGTLFALPDLRGRVPVGENMAPGSVFGTMGSVQGEEKHTLTEMEMPTHTHTSSNPSSNVIRTPIHLADNTGRHTRSQSVLTYTSPLPADNFGGTCGTNASSAQTWAATADTLTGGSNGQCGCGAPIDAYVQNAAIGIFPTATNTGDTSAQLGIFHPSVNSSCSTVQYESDPYSHSHTNANAGGSMPLNIVQPSVVIGGYMIKI